MSALENILMIAIKGYQRFISPVLPPRCRFYPSCSSYMMQAIAVHGAFKGVYLGLKRFLRCHPFAHGGIDEVPVKQKAS